MVLASFGLRIPCPARCPPAHSLAYFPVLRRHASRTVDSFADSPPAAPPQWSHTDSRELDQTPSLTASRATAARAHASRAAARVAHAAAQLSATMAVTGVALGAATSAGVPFSLLSAALAGGSLMAGALSAYLRHSWAYILEPVAPRLISHMIRQRLHEARASTRRRIGRAAGIVRRAIGGRKEGADPFSAKAAQPWEADSPARSSSDEPNAHPTSGAAMMPSRPLGRIFGAAARHASSLGAAVRSTLEAHVQVLAPWAVAALGVAVHMAAAGVQGTVLGARGAGRGGRQGLAALTIPARP
jgi:hypothetical protein